MNRWWVAPGEELWRGDAARVVFDGDDGSALWSLRLEDFGDGARKITWDYQMQAFLADAKDLRSAIREPLNDALKEASAPQTTLSASERWVLDQIASETWTAANNVISGRRLRQEAKAQKVDIGDAVERLMPRLVSMPFSNDERYCATLEGLLLSTRTAGPCHGFLTKLLSFIGQQYDKDPDRNAVALKEIESIAPESILHALFDKAELSSSFHGKQWILRSDIEAISEHRDAVSFLAWIRTGKSGRAWRSAPLRAEPSTPATPATQVAPQAPVTVFYSWQSDLANRENRSKIQKALESAAKLAAPNLEAEVVIDRDTQGAAGAIHIADTILEKIDQCAVFVADVSIIGRNPRPTPNPNVLFELGYAVRVLGWTRIVLVMNVKYGKPEDLPFDLRMHRALEYSTQDGEEDSAEGLRKELANAISVCARAPKRGE